MPEGWERKKILDLGNVVTGKTPYTKESKYFGGEIPFIKTPDMHGSMIVISIETYLSEDGANTQISKLLPTNSILVSCIGTVGVVALNAFPSQTNQQINSIIPKFNYYTYYTLFLAEGLKDYLISIGAGATMSNVNKQKFETIEITLPAKSVLLAFHETVSPIFNQIKTLTHQTQKLRKAHNRNITLYYEPQQSPTKNKKANQPLLPVATEFVKGEGLV